MIDGTPSLSPTHDLDRAPWPHEGVWCPPCSKLRSDHMLHTCQRLDQPIAVLCIGATPRPGRPLHPDRGTQEEAASPNTVTPKHRRLSPAMLPAAILLSSRLYLLYIPLTM